MPPRPPYDIDTNTVSPYVPPIPLSQGVLPDTAMSRRGRPPDRRTRSQRAWRKNTWKFRMSAANGPFCKICGTRFSDLNPRTFDHIIPNSAKGYSNESIRSPENFRVMCECCNILRGVAEGCLGLLACAVAVSEDRRLWRDGRYPKKALNGVPRAVGRIINKWLHPKPQKTPTGTNHAARKGKRKKTEKRKLQRAHKREVRRLIVSLLRARAAVQVAFEV